MQPTGRAKWQGEAGTGEQVVGKEVEVEQSPDSSSGREDR